MLTDKNILLLLSFAISCNGFFWQTNQVPLQQQAVQPQNDFSYKQVPLSYFRTYTYQPLTYPPAPYTSVQAYPVTTRLYPNNMPANNWQRQSQPIQNGMPPLQPMPQQQMQQPQQALPQQPLQPQQQQQQPQQLQLPQQPQQEFLPQPMPPTQQLKPSPPAPPMYGSQPSDSYNYQYLSSAPSMNVQHVQFVPCMCPVTVTVSSSSPDVLSADKRADDLATSESNESIAILSVDEKTNNLSNL